MASKLNRFLLEKKKIYKTVDLKEFSTENGFLNEVAKLLEEGADIIELKSPNATAFELLGIGKKLRVLTAQFDALLIIYDRVDIAKLIESDGVSLDKNSMPVKDAVLLTENSMLIGFQADNEEVATIAQNEDADYLVVQKAFTELDIHQFCTNLK